jgi:release factor glutamine methyltransferase
MPRSAASGPDSSYRGSAADSIYLPREDSLLLLPFSRLPAGRTLLEVGAGAGIASLAAAREGARVVATDRNPHALRYLRDRARDVGLEIGLVRTDLAAGLGRFDRVLANPPYLPLGPEERDPDRWHNLALDGGPDGCRVTARLVDTVGDHLAVGASAFVVVSSLQSAEGLARVADRWTSAGGVRNVVAERRLEGETLAVWELKFADPT